MSQNFYLPDPKDFPKDPFTRGICISCGKETQLEEPGWCSPCIKEFRRNYANQIRSARHKATFWYWLINLFALGSILWTLFSIGRWLLGMLR